jgi:hypothetical protein
MAYGKQGTQKYTGCSCQGAYGNGSRDKLGYQNGPYRPVFGTGHTGEHIDHSFPGTYRVAGTAHPDPEFQENPADHHP